MRYKSEETMREIVEAIEGYFFTHKETPSITEIARSTGRSRSTVHAYLQEMNKNGQIHYDGVTLETPVTSKADSGYSLSPIIGSIACGEPQYEEENFEAYVALPDALFGPGDHFILRTKGESMIEAGIDPGDLVVVRKQNTADDGDIVVALVDNETTLKRFYIDKEKKCVRLHPENRTMNDILVKSCYIQGVAQHVIKAL